MNENIVFVLIIIASYIAYKKYSTYKVLKLVPSLLEEGGQIIDVRSVDEFVVAKKRVV